MISLQKQIYWVQWAQRGLAIFFVAGMGVFFLCLFRPARQELSKTREQIDDVNLQLAKNDDAARDLPAIEREVQRLRDQITRSRRLPRQQELPQFIRDITQLSQSNRLEQFRYEPESQRRQQLCAELPVTLMFEGNFSDVAAFLRQAEEMPRLTRTRKVQIRTKDGSPGSVIAQVSMDIYFMDGQ